MIITKLLIYNFEASNRFIFFVIPAPFILRCSPFTTIYKFYNSFRIMRNIHTRIIKRMKFKFTIVNV